MNGIDKIIHLLDEVLNSKIQDNIVWNPSNFANVVWYYAEEGLYLINIAEGGDIPKRYCLVHARNPNEAVFKAIKGRSDEGAKEPPFQTFIPHQTGDLIAAKCDELKAMLLEKNRKYGDSALNPCRVFSRAKPVEQILVRIDDKLNRIKNRQNDEDEDVVLDLAGYLVLLMVAKDAERKK